MANGSVSIGRIFGIEVELNWLFILFTLFLYILSPQSAFIWIILFVFVLFHELSHSTTAIRNGIGISKIILMPLGGVSVMEEMNVPPKVAFNIAIVGPMTNFVLGGIFGIAVLFTPPGILTQIMEEFFVINMLLGISNIIPAYPLDGARVLSSYFEKTRTKYESTMLTVNVSKVCMALIIIASIIYFIESPTLTNELLLIIDIFIVYLFLYPATNVERDFAVIGRWTMGMKVKDAITKNYAAISPDATLDELYELVKSSKEHTILAKMPSGEFFLVDIFDKIAYKNAKTVKDLLVTIPNLQANSKLVDSLLKIETNAYKTSAVLNGKILVGIVTSSHINALVSLRANDKGGRQVFK